jgi:hypothetical protein
MSTETMYKLPPTRPAAASNCNRAVVSAAAPAAALQPIASASVKNPGAMIEQ